jgi:hypothetical protein
VACHFGIRRRRQTPPFLLGGLLRWGLMLQVRTYVLAWLHALVQDPHYFHQPRPNYAVVRDLQALLTFASASPARIVLKRKLRIPRDSSTGPSGRTSWFSRDFAPPGREDRHIVALAFARSAICHEAGARAADAQEMLL